MQYSATDNNGVSAANQFVITLTGTNDIPVVDTIHQTWLLEQRTLLTPFQTAIAGWVL